VTKDVSSFAIVAGSPAREIRQRFSEEVIEVLEEIRWWDWSLERMRRNKQFFEMNLAEVNSSELKGSIVE
jgi:hypothetical protein